MDSLSPINNAHYLSTVSGYVHPQPPPPEPPPRPEPPGPSPRPPLPPSGGGANGMFADFVQSMTPTERADAVPSAMQLENLEMSKHYVDDYKSAEAEYDTTDGDATTAGSSDSTGGGLSSPQFYESMYKDAKALNLNEWIQEHLYQLENLDVMRGLFGFNSAVIVNAGAANGLRIPPGFMSDENYRGVYGAAGAGGGVQSLEAALSPQNVAQRSVDMMVSMYNGPGGTGAEAAAARQGYAGAMQAMAQRSYEQSRGQIVGANSDARSALSQTQDLISRGLDDFARNGPDPAKSQPGGLYDQLRVYANSGRTAYEPNMVNGIPISPESLALGGAPSMINTQA